MSSLAGEPAARFSVVVTAVVVVATADITAEVGVATKVDVRAGGGSCVKIGDEDGVVDTDSGVVGAVVVGTLTGSGVGTYSVVLVLAALKLGEEVGIATSSAARTRGGNSGTISKSMRKNDLKRSDFVICGT